MIWTDHFVRSVTVRYLYPHISFKTFNLYVLRKQLPPFSFDLVGKIPIENQHQIEKQEKRGISTLRTRELILPSNPRRFLASWDEVGLSDSLPLPPPAPEGVLLLAASPDASTESIRSVKGVQRGSVFITELEAELRLEK